MPQRKPFSGRAVHPKTKKYRGRCNKRRPFPEGTPSNVVLILTFCPETGRIYAGANCKEHNYGQLTVATGKIDKGEKPYQAALREASEEGKFQVKLIGKQPITTLTGTGLNGRPLTFHVFISMPKKKDNGTYERPSDSDEIQYWQKYPITDLLRWGHISERLKEAIQAFTGQYDDGKFEKIQFFKDTPPCF